MDLFKTDSERVIYLQVFVWKGAQVWAERDILVEAANSI